MEPQLASQQKEDDWSFLDAALDWEALLDEPILETVMEDAPLELKPSPDSQLSQDTGFSFEQFLAGQLQPGYLPAAAHGGAADPSSLLSDAQASGRSASDAAYASGAAYTPLPTNDASSPEVMGGIGGGIGSGIGRGGTGGAASGGGASSSGELPRASSSGDGGGRCATTSASQGGSGDDGDASPRGFQVHSDAPQPGGGGRLASARQAAITAREKNRAAQRRYRNRKKEQLQESEERLADLQRQLAQVQLDKDELVQRNRLLERVASMQQAKQRSEAAEVLGVADRIKSWWQDPGLVEMMEQKMQLKGPFVFTVRPDAPLFLTRRQIINMPLQEFRDLYREYINVLAAHLLKLSTDPDDATQARLERLSFESGQMKSALLVSLPQLMSSMHWVLTGRVLDSSPWGAAVTVHKKQQKLAQLAQSDTGGLTDADWDQMVASSRLTEAQRGAVLALRGVYLRNIGALAARRRDLVALIQASIAAMPPGGGENPREWELTSADAYGAHTLGAFDQLQATLRDEHTVLMLFSLSVGRRVLTPLQHAHLNVTAFPFKPYITKLAEAVARATEGAPSAAELMASGMGTTPEIHSAAFDDYLPESMRGWSESPTADLAALYPGSEFPPEMVAAASGLAAEPLSGTAAVVAVAAEALPNGGQEDSHSAADGAAA